MITNVLNRHVLDSVKQIIPVWNVLEGVILIKDLNDPF